MRIACPALFRPGPLAALLAVLVAALAAMLPGPLAQAQGYVAQPGDVLRIEVIEDSSLNREVLVTPDGSFAFPFVGSVAVRGQTVDQIRRRLTTALAPQFANEPTVFVSVARLSQTLAEEDEAVSVFLTGEIANPGRLQVEPGTTILQAIAAAGGLSRFAADRRIELRRTDHTGRVLRYRFAFDGDARSISAATTLVEGDVIVVPERRLFEFN